ncbi:hypothetical protein EYF80_061016 [Liparis tanakae]|uniref:Uncharacterized protein n=1 Tax=Liparis tanakae TaxID=230148 RepID=A0A4Z2EJA8_9TELE|nr:hypothetical protein EYF80_061016 [Liparis tanakae]
MHPDPLSKAL